MAVCSKLTVQGHRDRCVTRCHPGLNLKVGKMVTLVYRLDPTEQYVRLGKVEKTSLDVGKIRKNIQVYSTSASTTLLDENFARLCYTVLVLDASSAGRFRQQVPACRRIRSSHCSSGLLLSGPLLSIL